MTEVERSHLVCHGPDGHVCQEPSGRTCIKKGCDRPVGTLWGPLWCPEHAEELLEDLTTQLERGTK